MGGRGEARGEARGEGERVEGKKTGGGRREGRGGKQAYKVVQPHPEQVKGPAPGLNLGTTKTIFWGFCSQVIFLLSPSK